jgi:N-formylglutamate amidohydrolase
MGTCLKQLAMRFCFLSALLLLSAIATSQGNPPPGAVSDATGYTTFYPGSMPLVISAPHGGTWNLTEVKDRSCEGAVTATDNNTKELAFEISEAMFKYHGFRPYLIVCNISRKDVDQNREINEATCGEPSMAAPWQVFHGYIDSALKEAVHRLARTWSSGAAS